MGGVGKSTMINEVHVQVFKQSMFDQVAKVEVKAEVDITRIQEEIASALGLTLEKNSTAVRAADLRKRLLQKPNDQKKRKTTVLIILDDLVEKLDLQAVGIPSSNDEVQIKLLLTSRDEYVLTDKMRAQPIHLDVLSNLDALEMFKTAAGLENVGENAKKLEKAKLIVPRCGGLPVVILAIANALKNKALKEWEDTLQRLDVRDALSNLEVSYEHLPSQESKHLFLLCGIIRGPQIQVRDLLKYTFGLGLYERKDIYTLAAAATELEKLLSGLKAASMLLKGDDLGYVRIHDHMRDLAIMIVERDHHEWVHFTLRDDRCEIPRRFDASKLELILSYCEEGDSQLQIPDSFVNDMKKLYVLGFTNLNGGFSLGSPTGQLDHLRKLETLCLHKCSLSDISMIGELKGLRILSFQGSDIRKLPIHLRALTALKMLDLSDCEQLTQIEPCVLESLTKLEELNMENSFKNWETKGGDAPFSNARLIELKKMSRLSNVRICIPSASMLPQDGQLFSSKLTMYKIMFGYSDSYSENEYNKFSRVLMLTFDSPDILWMDWVQTTLQTAEVLYLSGRLDGKCESMGEICIKGFDCLKHLRMRHCPSFRFIISPNDVSFTNLESLFIEHLESLESLCAGLPRHEEALSKLRVVNVENCSKLTHLFDFSLLKGRLSSHLEKITIMDCSKIQCIVANELGDNYNEVVTLSNLQYLEFKDLSKFSSFCAGPSENVLFTGKRVAFPCLETLMIDGLGELEHIWHPTEPPAELGNLQFLFVERCNKLVRVINSNVLMMLQQNLEYLSIRDCGLMKEVFEVDDGIITSYCTDLDLFSQLKTLRLKQLDRLEGVDNNKNLMMIMNDGRSMRIFPNIESLYVLDCPHLRYVLCCSLRVAGVEGYENLKEISVDSCEEMESIVIVMLKMVDDQEIQQAATAIGHDPPRHHQKYYDAVSHSYSSLKKIMIYGCCPKLRTFCQYFCSEQDYAADNLAFFSQKEIFPCLESLALFGLSKLGAIWPDEVPSDESSFKLLNDVDIANCPELSVVFPSTLIPHLTNLQHVRLHKCDQMMQIVIVEEKNSKRRHAVQTGGGSGASNSTIEEEEHDGEAGKAMIMEMMCIFPSLRTLILRDLQKLDRFYSSLSSAACSFQFPSLETLEITRCSGVKTLFSHHDSDTVEALFRFCDRLAIPNLSFIELSSLENLTRIWKQGEKGEGLILKLETLILNECSSSYTNLQSLIPASSSCWSALRKLDVYYCNGLEYLLTPVGAKRLVHLTSLSIRDCRNIKEVVSVEEEEVAAAARGGDDHMIGYMITFHQLKELDLFCLPSIEKFSSVNNMVLNFPSLKDFEFGYCPNMTTFSSGIATAPPHMFGDLNFFFQKKIYKEYDDDW